MKSKTKSIALIGAGIMFGVALMLTCQTGPPSADAQDASLNPDGGTIGDCCTITGPLQMIPASENPQQIVKGFDNLVSSISGIEIAQGPLILTDAYIVGQCSSGCVYYLSAVPQADSCPRTTELASSGLLASIRVTDGYRTSITGARLVVQQGEKLCLNRNVLEADGVAWSGFRPY